MAESLAKPVAQKQSPYVAHLRLQNFRNYAALSCRFGAHINILIGANGVGKTNILEAVSLLGPGRGLRGAQFADIVPRQGDGGWAIGADLGLPQGDSRVRVEFSGGGRKLSLDDQANARFDDLAHLMPQLWFTPAMDRLFVDTAAGRRKFFDRFVASLFPSFSSAAAAYEKAMRERNRLLADGGAHGVWLTGLEETMAVQGTAMALARLESLDILAAGLAQMPDTVFPRGRIGLAGDVETALRGQQVLAVEDMMRHRLAQDRALDMAAGRTLFGPHRSDLIVFYAAKDMPAAQCSTGEQKALLVGLILAQANCIVARTGDVPILLLDEVAAHLDANRRQALAETLQDLGGQVWITGTDEASFSSFAPFSDFFTVADEAIRPQFSALRDG